MYESSVIQQIPTGYISMLLSEPGPQWKPILITNWWQYQAIFGYNLTNIRIYREGYLDKVMVSGINKDGQRERIYLNKYPKTYKKDRNRWFHTKEK